MSSYNEKIDYQKAIAENIEIAKLISNLPEKECNKVKELLIKRKKLQLENGLFAQLRINSINNKIAKIRKVNNEEKKSIKRKN